MNIDPYVMLGLSSSATEDDIKRMYRRLAQRFHPDTNPDNPGAAAQFQEITAAYNLLSDPLKRQVYDRSAREVYENDQVFSLRATPSKRAVMPLDEPQVIYLLAEMVAPPLSTQQQTGDAHLNLTLVLDTSNSMDGTRIERVKVAAQRIINDLSPGDFISIVTFNDRANVIVPATRVEDKLSLNARVTMISPSGGTEIFQGLSAGVAENRKNLNNRYVNHVILLTDGHTYGDQERCLELADTAGAEGISISAMGLGHDWNDQFLDELASRTGAHSTYIQSEKAVSKFLNDQVKSLSDSFAERMILSVAPDPDVQLEMVFMLSPNPQPLSFIEGKIPLGTLQNRRPIHLLLQFLMPGSMSHGFRPLGRLMVHGNILRNQKQVHTTVSDISIEVTDSPGKEAPPASIMDALSKLRLYRIQEKAQNAIEEGNVEEATHRLETLATRLLEMGESSLARQAITEADHIQKRKKSSAEGLKNIKYSTRALVGSDSDASPFSSLFDNE